MTPKSTLAAIAVVAITACAPPPAPTVVLVPNLPPDPFFASLDAYKKRVAGRIVEASVETYAEPLPGMMKSIVVLDITVDRFGHPLDVSVYRSNGYRSLEQRALASVIKAAPFAQPEAALLDGAASLSFLETFLFRDDDFFQVRSLVGKAWKSSITSQPASTGL
jgi:protein TonB